LIATGSGRFRQYFAHFSGFYFKFLDAVEALHPARMGLARQPIGCDPPNAGQRALTSNLFALEKTV
jgi:hypothetical protein